MTGGARGVCRAGCGEPLDERLIDADDRTGLHYLCTDPARPVEAALERAFGPVEDAGPPYRVGDVVTVGGLDFTKIADEQTAPTAPAPYLCDGIAYGDQAQPYAECGAPTTHPAHPLPGGDPLQWCYRCQMGDLHPGIVHATADDHFGNGAELRTDEHFGHPGGLVAPAAAGAPEPAPPPSTLDTVRGLLIDYELSRPRTQQVALGPSELGTPCRRQIAAKLAGTPQPALTQPPWAPMCGTAVHTLMEAVLARDNARLGRPRWLIESKLQIADGIRGHGDAYDIDTQTVIDWKYTGTTARRKAARRNCDNKDRVSQEYRVQAHLYGLGHVNAGRPVGWVRLVLLARSHDFGESVEWTERYRPDIAEWAVRRYESIKNQVVHLGLANVAAGGNTDALTAALRQVKASPSEEVCKWCPFLGGVCQGNRPEGPDGLQASRDKFAAGLVGEA